MVSTHLKNISQIGNLPQIGVKIKNIWKHHLDEHDTCWTWICLLDTGYPSDPKSSHFTKWFFHGDESPTVGFVPTKITNKNTSKETGIPLENKHDNRTTNHLNPGNFKVTLFKTHKLVTFSGAFFVTCHFGEWNSVTNFKKLEEVNSPMKNWEVPSLKLT